MTASYSRQLASSQSTGAPDQEARSSERDAINVRQSAAAERAIAEKEYRERSTERRPTKEPTSRTMPSRRSCSPPASCSSSSSVVRPLPAAGRSSAKDTWTGGGAGDAAVGAGAAEPAPPPGEPNPAGRRPVKGPAGPVREATTLAVMARNCVPGDAVRSRATGGAGASAGDGPGADAAAPAAATPPAPVTAEPSLG